MSDIVLHIYIKNSSLWYLHRGEYFFKQFFVNSETVERRSIHLHKANLM